MEVSCRENGMHRTMLNIENEIPCHRKHREKKRRITLGNSRRTVFQNEQRHLRLWSLTYPAVGLLLPLPMRRPRRRIIQGEADPPHLPESGQGWQECCQDRKDHHRQDAAGIFQSATHQEALQHGAFACPRPPKSEQSSLCDHLAESGKSPALRGFVGERRALATTSLYLVRKSNRVFELNSACNRICRAGILAGVRPCLH